MMAKPRNSAHSSVPHNESMKNRLPERLLAGDVAALGDEDLCAPARRDEHLGRQRGDERAGQSALVRPSRTRQRHGPKASSAACHGLAVAPLPRPLSRPGCHVALIEREQNWACGRAQ